MPETKKKKVLHLITGVELGGGAENMLLQFLPLMQDKLENRVCAIMGRGEVGKKLEKLGISVYYLDLKNIYDLRAVGRYRKVLNDFQPDIQVNYLIHADIFGRIFGKIFGIKKIVSYIRSVHTVKTKIFFYFLEKLSLFLSDIVLANSETNKEFYINKLGVDKEKISCIPNAIDINKFLITQVNKIEKIQELGLPSDRIIIGTVSRLEKIKDIPTIIEAFSKINKINKNIYLLIIGHGPEKKNILTQIKKLGLEENITLLEKRTDIAEILSVMNIFVLASNSEGMSNALLEAMASQKVIITSNICENMELIKDGENGLNFKTGNADDLASKMIYCLENHQKVSDYSRRALATVQKKYNLSEIVKKYTDFLLKL